MKKILFFIALLLVTFTFQTEVAAQTFVKDGAQVLSTETIQAIDRLNSEKFSKLAGEPEYAVVTLPSLDGQSIEDATQELFDRYQFGKKDVNNGLVFVFAIEDREFRLGYGDGLAPIFIHTDADDLVDETAKELLRAEDYDGAIQRASNTVFDYVAAFDQEHGLTQAYAEGPALIAQQKAADKKAAQTTFVGIASTLSAAVLGLVGFLGLRRVQIKKRLLKTASLPSWLTSDPIFEQSFLSWANHNQRRFALYKNAADQTAGIKAYLVEEYFPKQCAAARLSDDTKALLQQAMRNEDIQLYFAESSLQQSSFTLTRFAQEIQAAASELDDYPQHLAQEIAAQVSACDLQLDILPENAALIPAYKEKISELVQEHFAEQERNGNDLAAVLLQQATYPSLIQELPEKIAQVIESVKTDALFQVDVAHVYQTHPELKDRIDQFDGSDYEEVLGGARNQYRHGATDNWMLYTILLHQTTHQEEVIANAESSSGSSFGGFGGGMSSGGGVSGGW